MADYPATPMLDKEKEAREKGHSQEIGEFLEWLADAKGIVLARYDEVTDECRNCGHEDAHTYNIEGEIGHGMDYVRCGFENGEGEPACDCDWDYRGTPDRLWPITETRVQLLADHFGIDSKIAEEERRAVLAYVQAQNAEGNSS